mmetsp:Transcript_35189/g.82008  ORF Transcript_35189/g.82008 Transcript_35189/m.82008 type:complete len:259 (+) Transcript_35189:1648-2424(+)
MLGSLHHPLVILEETVSLFEEGLQLGGVLQEIERPHHLAGAFSSEDLLFQVLFQGGLLAELRGDVVKQHRVRARLRHGPQPLEALLNEASLGSQQESLGDDDGVPNEERMHPSQRTALHHVCEAHAGEVVRSSSIPTSEEMERAKYQNGGDSSGQQAHGCCIAELNEHSVIQIGVVCNLLHRKPPGLDNPAAEACDVRRLHPMATRRFRLLCIDQRVALPTASEEATEEQRHANAHAQRCQEGFEVSLGVADRGHHCR